MSEVRFAHFLTDEARVNLAMAKLRAAIAKRRPDLIDKWANEVAILSGLPRSDVMAEAERPINPNGGTA